MAIDNRQVAKNIIFSALSEGSNLFLFLLLIMAARYLGDVEFGKYCFALSFVNLFMMMGDWGISYSTSIQISRDRSKARFFLGNLLGLQAFTGILILLLITVLTHFLRLEKDVRLILLLQTFVLMAKSYKITFRWMFKAFERFDLESLTLLIERAANFLVGILVLLAGYGLVPFVATFLAVKVSDAILSGLILRAKVIFSRPRIQPREWIRLIRKGLPFAVAYTLQHVFFQIDTIMLSLMRTNQEVGWYNAPFRIIEGLLVVPCIISYALIPTLSQSHMVSKETVTGLFRRGSKYMILMALPLIFLVTTFSAPLIRAIFGAQYLPATSVFKLLMCSTIFIFLSHLSTTVLYCIDRQIAVIWVALAAVCFNITMNALLIPRYGIMGAGLATFMTQALYMVVTFLLLWRQGYRPQWGAIVLKPSLAGAACFAAFLLSRSWGPARSSALAFTVYLAGLTLLRTWDRHELDVIKGLLDSWRAKLRGR